MFLWRRCIYGLCVAGVCMIMKVEKGLNVYWLTEHRWFIDY
jgi:hypothetical protein